MTGIEDYNFPHFLAVERCLKDRGIEVVNPVHICRKYKRERVLSDKSVFDQMIQDELEALKTCDTILLLNGWNYSKGAKKELTVAVEHSLDVWLESESGVRMLLVAGGCYDQGN